MAVLRFKEFSTKGEGGCVSGMYIMPYINFNNNIKKYLNYSYTV